MTEKWTPPDRICATDNDSVGRHWVAADQQPFLQTLGHPSEIYLRATPEREAAPDLYEALEQSERALESARHLIGRVDFAQGVSDANRAALSRARGETP